MKIAFIVPAFPVVSETFIVSQITALIDKGHDIDLYAQVKPAPTATVHPQVLKYGLMGKLVYLPAEIDDRLERLRWGVRFILRNLPRHPWQVLRALNPYRSGKAALSLEALHLSAPFLGKRYDIIACHFGTSGLIGASLKRAGIRGALVTFFHGYDVNLTSITGQSAYYENLFSVGDHFIANTDYTRQQAIALGCDPHKISILPVGLDMSKFRYRRAVVRTHDKLIILTIGRLVEKKGHEYMLRALRDLVARHPKVEYRIAGDGPLRPRLEALVAELRLSDHVSFLGPVNELEAVKLYQSADIFVLPSVTAANGDKEGQALVLQEAQAIGLPVVSTLHNGIPDGLLNGESGFLVPERDVAALVSKIAFLIERPEVRRSMGRKGRNFVESRYDVARLNKELVSIFRQLSSV